MSRSLRVDPLWRAVLDPLREEILTGALPAGARLVEADLAAAFGTSRGPIREALRELGREGLVVELPRRGAVVSTLTTRDLHEVYAVREALDCRAAQDVVSRASDEEIRGLETHLTALESGGGAYLDRSPDDMAFHRALIALAGNSRMIAINDQMLSQTMMLLSVAARENESLRTDMRPAAHRAIFDALVARDADGARAALEEHYRYAEERLFPGLGS